MPLGYILFGCILIIYSFTFLRGRTCLVLAKGRNPTSVLKHLPPLLHAPSPSPRSSVPQHFCPFCQVPQTSASSTPALLLKNVSGKNLGWLSPSETYSSLFGSHPSRAPPRTKKSLDCSFYWYQSSLPSSAFLFTAQGCGDLTKAAWQSKTWSLISLPLLWAITPNSLSHGLYCKWANFSSFFLQPVPDRLLNLPLRLYCILFYYFLLK